MKSSKIILSVCLACLTDMLYAQTTLPIPRNIQAAFNKDTRSITGKPGKNYWQNSADYNLQIRFEPATRLISGTEEITYTNNSPDTLKEIVFKLYPNLYQKGAIRLRKIDAADINDGVKIDQFKIDGRPQAKTELFIDGTNMRVPVSPLAPKQSLHFNIEYNYILNKTSHIRTGEVDNGSWFIAYFFPRIAVYDDIDGWNMNPYLGTQEFYNDFCNFKLNVTVPEDYIVWATGDLKNCTEVLNPEYCRRLAKAESSDGITTIIDSTDLKKGGITTNHPENTFRFEAGNVTDVAVAISNHYQWKSSSLVVDSSSGRRTRVDAVFNPQHRDFYEVVDFARKIVESMSYKHPAWPFPYSHETVFNGLDEMEYPMMVNDTTLSIRTRTMSLTSHEIFHTMFPFYMGTNETKYGWMDEGWSRLANWIITPMVDTTVVNTSPIDLYTPKLDKTLKNISTIDLYEQFAGKEEDLPVITPSTQEFSKTLKFNSYTKPALGYLYVKDMLGDELFYKGLHQYIRDWHGRHPMPYDFFNSMNTGSGVNLDWFWKRWFFENGTPDLAIGKFSEDNDNKKVLIEMVGEKPLPIDLTIIYLDGSSQKIHRSATAWEQGNRTVEISFISDKNVHEIVLGSTYVPDVNKKDNHLIIKN